MVHFNGTPIVLVSVRIVEVKHFVSRADNKVHTHCVGIAVRYVIVPDILVEDRMAIVVLVFIANVSLKDQVVRGKLIYFYIQREVVY